MSNDKIQKNKKYKKKNISIGESFPKYKESIIFGIVSFILSFLISQNAGISIIFSELFIWLFFLPQLNSGNKHNNKIDIGIRYVLPILISVGCLSLIGVDIFTFGITFILFVLLLMIFKTTKPISCFVINVFISFFLFLLTQASSASFLSTLKVIFTVSDDKSFFYLNDKYVFILGVALIYCVINIFFLFVKTKKAVYNTLGFLALLFNCFNLLSLYLLKENFSFFVIKRFFEAFPSIDYINFLTNNLKTLLGIIVSYVIYVIIINKGMRNEMIFAKRKRIIYALCSLVALILILIYLSKHNIYEIPNVSYSYFYYLLKPIFGIKIL